MATLQFSTEGQLAGAACGIALIWITARDFSVVPRSRERTLDAAPHHAVSSDRWSHQEKDMNANAFTKVTFNPVPPTPFFDAWTGIAGVYRDAMQSSAQQWIASSAGIIQEHTLRAFIHASQACADALAKNAMSMQQKSMERLVDANQKAVGMMGQAFTDAWMGSMRPAAHN